MTTRLPVGVFFALFTVSGFAGLIYQSIWSHYLKLFLGHAAYAQTLVLAIFMGGMAIGSWLVSRHTERIANLLIGYAIAELGIGILALVFHRTFLAVTGWGFDHVMPVLGGTGVDLFKWSLASALILPASILLGTTFPLMSAGILRLYPQAGGRALSMLYFTNSFGAAIGVLASGFYLIDRFGLPGTILTAGIMNVVLAIVVYGLAKRLPVATVAPFFAASAGEAAQARRLTRAILVLALATGAASFIYEITWIRMLTLGLGASTHAFEVMLAAFILAMSLGAFWFRNRIGSVKNDLAWLSGLVVAKALFAVYAIWIYSDVLAFMGWMMRAVARTDGGYALNTIAGLVASMVVMFPAAFCAGMTLPLATHALTSRGLGEACIGKVYGANTAGCILGAIFATHFGMELLGVKGLTGAGALLDISVGVAVASLATWSARPAIMRALLAGGAAAGLAAFFAAPLDRLAMSSGVYRHGIFLDPASSSVLFYRDGKTATIAVVDSGPVRSIRTNGKPDAGMVIDRKRAATGDEATMLLLGVLPLALKPGAGRVANIGFGSGLTTHYLLGSPRVRHVDTIEIERMIVEGARHFAPRNARAYSDPRSHLRIEDAKTFFASSGQAYDIIVSEPSNPWVSGVSTLFSEEFYAQAKRYLRADGLLVQWVQAYEIDLGLLSSIFKALGRHFADYAVYRTGSDLIVVATPTGRMPELTADVLSFPALSPDLAAMGFVELGDFESLRVGGRRVLEPLFERSGFPANSDYFPILDQRAPRARFRNQQIEDLPRLRDALVPVLAMLDGETRTPLGRVQSGGLNRPARVDAARIAAEAIGVSLSGAAQQAAAMQPQQKAAALLVNRLMSGCREAEAEWLDALTEVARTAMPFLAAGDVEVLLAKVRGSPCARSLDEAGRHRLAWLEAINRRDATAMREHSVALLANLPAHLEGERVNLLAAALASNLVLGRAADAALLRDGHMPAGAKGENDGLLLQLVLAHVAAANRPRPQ
ncbi:MAG: methyltransferase [Usitatibacter sp.]